MDGRPPKSADCEYFRHKVLLLNCSHHYHTLCARTVHLRATPDALVQYRALLEEASVHVGARHYKRLFSCIR